MRKSIREKLLLVGACLLIAACLLSGSSTWGQSGPSLSKSRPISVDIGITYAAERAHTAPGQCDCFWLYGGGLDAAATVWKGLGIAAAFTGDHASNVEPGVDVNKISYMAGPRYKYTPAKGNAGLKNHLQFFGEGLFGGTHGFGGAFPSGTGLNSSANSFAMQIGGGMHISVSNRLAIRVVQADYVRTTLPNNFSNVQNDLRLGAGIVLHSGSRHSPQ